MSIAPSILKHYPELNDAQRAIVGHLDGPLLVIAGPGSGKTYSVVLRALNLLLLEKADLLKNLPAGERRDKLRTRLQKALFPSGAPNAPFRVPFRTTEAAPARP